MFDISRSGLLTKTGQEDFAVLAWQRETLVGCNNPGDEWSTFGLDIEELKSAFAIRYSVLKPGNGRLQSNGPHSVYVAGALEFDPPAKPETLTESSVDIPQRGANSTWRHTQ